MNVSSQRREGKGILTGVRNQESCRQALSLPGVEGFEYVSREELDRQSRLKEEEEQRERHVGGNDGAGAGWGRAGAGAGASAAYRVYRKKHEPKNTPSVRA